MNKILILAVICCFGYAAKAQLASTSWIGTMNVQGGMDAIFNYGKDTLVVINPSDNSTIETMTYSVNDSIISIKKVDGTSPCDNETVGKYSYKLENDQLTMKLVADDCSERAQAIESITLKKNQQ